MNILKAVAENFSIHDIFNNFHDFREISTKCFTNFYANLKNFYNIFHALRDFLIRFFLI